MLNNWNVWDDYSVITWILAKPLSNLRGAHTLGFSKRTDEFCEKLQSLQNSQKVNKLCVSLKSFCRMCELLSLVFLDEFNTTKKFSQEAVRLLPKQIKQK